MEKLEKVEYIIVHHSGRTIDSPNFIKFRHKFIRHWDDVGYHFLIANGHLLSTNGRIYTGRQEGLIGYHALRYNRNSLGVCLVGNFNETVPTERQLSALLSLLKDKVAEYSIPIENIRGHREIPGTTSCPGESIDMDYIRERVSK